MNSKMPSDCTTTEPLKKILRTSNSIDVHSEAHNNKTNSKISPELYQFNYVENNNQDWFSVSYIFTRLVEII